MVVALPGTACDNFEVPCVSPILGGSLFKLPRSVGVFMSVSHVLNDGRHCQEVHDQRGLVDDRREVSLLHVLGQSRFMLE